MLLPTSLLTRGRTIEGKWVYGSYLKVPPYMACIVGDKEKFEKDTKHLIISLESSDWNLPFTRKEYEVLPNTVSFCTGLYAKNHYNYTNYIYEGDILKYEGECAIVVWEKHLARFSLKVKGETYPLSKEWATNCEIVGNIYEES